MEDNSEEMKKALDWRNKIRSNAVCFKGVTISLPKDSYDKLSCAAGTKFYLDDQELSNVSSFEIKPTGADSILQVTLTFPLHKVVYQEV